MVQSRENKVHKRSSNQNADTAKRRAPYALRACDACRRRKGKCDGRQPCSHCAGRGQDCSYNNSFVSEDWQSLSSTATADTDQAKGQRESRRRSSSTACDRDAIVEMLATLQDQLNNLASQVRPSTRIQLRSPSPTVAADCSGDENFVTALDNDAGTSQGGPDPARQQLRGASTQHFYGPTSPDYSLNVAQLKLRRNSLAGLPLQQRQFQLATIDEDASDEEDVADIQDLSPATQPQLLDRDSWGRLLQFRSLLGLQEAIRLLYLYQDVVGDLYPLIDLDEAVSRTRSYYTDPEPAVWDISPGRAEASPDEYPLILNLALAISLRADLNPASSVTENILRNGFQHAVNAKLATTPHSIKHVTIVLLNGLYEFFRDTPRSAWRMCGIAGRMLMELGFHNGEVSQHLLGSDAQREEAWILTSNIVILDRQWSSATGLRTHFNESSFSQIPLSCIKNPHAKAMLSFILISDRFSEPIAQAAKGEGYNDQEAFELMNFQIEQWRKKAVGEHTLAQCETWHTDSLSRPPTWSILLNLRAQSVRSLLLKPFFFSESDPSKIVKHIRPATELVFQVVNVLYTLDTTTNVYRNQHPNYQHLLASASALAFLLIASIEQNKATLLPSLSADLVDLLGHSFEMAVTLTNNYVKSSRAARRLSRRLREMKGILLCLGILKRPNPEGFEKANEPPSSHAGNTRPAQKSRPSQGVHVYPAFTSPFASRDTATAGLALGLPPHSATDVQSSWADSLRLQWPIGDGSNMFSESIF